MRVLALLALLVLAGCADVAPPEEADAPVDGREMLEVVFRPFTDLGSKAGIMDLGLGGFGTSCNDSMDDGDCGLGEPSVEVDGAGTIYVSGVCCITVAPPVYVSRDGGETFQTLDTPGIREAWGIEGDFAVDEKGRIYFADIELAGTFQMTVWEADGTFVRHTKWPAPPLVDRDWVRAEGDGHVYYVYNTGTSTNVYKSTDAATTWSPAPIFTAPYGLGNVAIDPGKEICLFGGSMGGMRRTDCSSDGGATWKEAASSLPVGGNDAYPVGAYDEAGNLWLAETQNIREGDTLIGQNITVTWRDANGTWHGPYQVSPPGFHRMPWLGAGAEGGVAIAWYGTNGTGAGGSNGDWFLHVGASADAFAGNATWNVQIADTEPVFQGSLGRDLLDFLQADIGPDGAVHVAYSKLRAGQGPDGNEEQLHHIRSEAVPELAMTEYWLGP